MKLFKSLLVAPAALGLLSPIAANASEVNLNGISNYSDVDSIEFANSFNNEDDSIESPLLAGGEGLVSGSSYDGGFSETTTASFSVDFLLGAEEGKGIATATPTDGDEAVEFNYSFQIDLNTSFTGEDSLDISIDGGDLGATDALSAASPNNEFDPNNTADALVLDGISYTFPLGDDFTVFVGDNTDGSMLFTTACVYGTPSDTLDDCGVPNAGITGGGVAAGASYDVGNGFTVAAGIQSTESGLLTDESVTDSYAFNAAYIADNYGISLTYANVEDGTGVTEDTYTGINGYVAFEGYPTLSAGVEYGDDDSSTDDWNDQFMSYFIGSTYPLGAGELGIGYGTHSLNDGHLENTDDEIMIEAYYSYPLNDGMTITPLVYSKEQLTAGQEDLTGVLVKTSFSF